MLEQILNSAQNLYVAAKDVNLKYIYCNENVARGLGLDSPKEIIGKTDDDLFSKNIASLYQSGDNRILKGGILVNEHEVQPHTNKTINILTTKNQIINNQHQCKGVIISFININNDHGLCSSDELKTKFNKNCNHYEFYIDNDKEYFTIKEYNIFRCLIYVNTNKTIAKLLNLSPRTVDDYVEKIRRKLQ